MNDRDKIRIASLELHRLSAQIDKLYVFTDQKAEALFWRAAGIGAIDYSKERVQTSPQNMMESAMVSLVDLQNKQHIHLSPIVKKVNEIKSLSVANSDVLLYKYVYRDSKRNHFTNSQIAKLLETTTDHIKYQHRIACVEYFDRFLNNH